METKLGIAKLKPNSKENVLKMIEWTKNNSELASKHMENKGYYWDSLFLESRPDGDYLIYVCKSSDWSKIKISDENPLNDWSRKYLRWKEETWESESMLPQNDILNADLMI